MAAAIVGNTTLAQRHLCIMGFVCAGRRPSLRRLHRLPLAFLALCISAANAEEAAPATTPSSIEKQAAPPTAPAVVEEQAPQWLRDCELPTDQEMLGLDWARRTVFTSVCQSARWFDGLFGDEFVKDSEMEGSIAFNLERREGGARDLTPRLRFRATLPNISKRLDVFLDREDENKTIVGQSENPAMAQLGQDRQESTQLGLGYELRRTINSLLNFRAGIRLREGKPDPFVRSRYNREFARRESSQWRFAQTIFWRNAEGFGETSALDFEVKLDGRHLLRWQNNATLSQDTEAFRWASALSLYRTLGENKAAQLSYSANGETGRAERVGNFGPRLSYRQQLNRKWLFGEIYVGIDYPKDSPEVARGRQSYIGVKIEATFQGH